MSHQRVSSFTPGDVEKSGEPPGYLWIQSAWYRMENGPQSRKWEKAEKHRKMATSGRKIANGPHADEGKKPQNGQKWIWGHVSIFSPFLVVFSPCRAVANCYFSANLWIAMHICSQRSSWEVAGELLGKFWASLGKLVSESLTPSHRRAKRCL